MRADVPRPRMLQEHEPGERSICIGFSLTTFALRFRTPIPRGVVPVSARVNPNRGGWCAKCGEALHSCDGYLDAARPKPDEDTKDVSHCVKGEYR